LILLYTCCVNVYPPVHPTVSKIFLTGLSKEKKRKEKKRKEHIQYSPLGDFLKTIPTTNNHRQTYALALPPLLCYAFYMPESRKKQECEKYGEI